MTSHQSSVFHCWVRAARCIGTRPFFYHFLSSQERSQFANNTNLSLNLKGVLQSLSAIVLITIEVLTIIACKPSNVQLLHHRARLSPFSMVSSDLTALREGRRFCLISCVCGQLSEHVYTGCLTRLAGALPYIYEDVPLPLVPTESLLYVAMRQSELYPAAKMDPPRMSSTDLHHHQAMVSALFVEVGPHLLGPWSRDETQSLGCLAGFAGFNLPGPDPTKYGTVIVF